ncbi:MAG: hypothetical protein WAM14_24805 [Candidatus Nitrosopolaris sp.]
MNNKRTVERIATIGLAAFLVGMFCYQVAYGTNESSYRLGLKYGYDKYQKCDTTCMNLDALGSECYTSPYVDNMTACNDGYAHAWIHEGQTQVATCILSGHNWDAGQCMSGKLVAITGPGHCYKTKDTGEMCESGDWIPTTTDRH